MNENKISFYQDLKGEICRFSEAWSSKFTKTIHNFSKECINMPQLQHVKVKLSNYIGLCSVIVWCLYIFAGDRVHV